MIVNFGMPIVGRAHLGVSVLQIAENLAFRHYNSVA